MHARGTLILAAILAAAAGTALAQQPARVPTQVRRPPSPAVLRPAPTPPTSPAAAPTIDSLRPIGVRPAGGQGVTVYGTGFVAGTTVSVAGQSVGVGIVSPTQLRFGAPAHAADTTDVVVTNGGGSATCTRCLTFDGNLGPGESYDVAWERGGEGPTGFWRAERYQKGVGAYVTMIARCQTGWLAIGGGIENSGNHSFFVAESYPLDNSWRILMQRQMVPPQAGALLYPPAPYAFFMTATCIDRDAFNRAMRPPS